MNITREPNPACTCIGQCKGRCCSDKFKLSAAGSRDYDGDSLKYEWTVTADSGKMIKTFNEPDPSVTLDQPGSYTAKLTVTSKAGLKNSQAIKIIAGNDPPCVDVDISGNKTFFFPGSPFEYNIKVSDKEDGKVDPRQVAVSIDYTSEGFDLAELKAGAAKCRCVYKVCGGQGDDQQYRL